MQFNEDDIETLNFLHMCSKYMYDSNISGAHGLDMTITFALHSMCVMDITDDEADMIFDEIKVHYREKMKMFKQLFSPKES